MRVFYSLMAIFLILCVTQAKEEEEKEGKKGKKVRYNKKGDIGVTVRWNKWRDPKQRTLCCPLAHKHCKYPCKGLSCKKLLKICLIRLDFQATLSAHCPAVSSQYSNVRQYLVQKPIRFNASQAPPAPAQLAGQCPVQNVSG